MTTITTRVNAESQLQGRKQYIIVFDVKFTVNTYLILVTIGVLLQSVSDKSPLVLETVRKSIRKLAEKHPNHVLHSCCKFCSKNSKPSLEHISSVLKIMESVCLEHILLLDGDTVIATIDTCLKIMTENVYVEPVVQIPASNVLVALGREHYVQVIICFHFV